MSRLRRADQPREQMPVVAGWIDELRAACGEELINNAMRAGMKSGGFWAIEGEFVAGRPPPEAIRRAEEEISHTQGAGSSTQG